jgi:hypothetical protein
LSPSVDLDLDSDDGAFYIVPLTAANTILELITAREKGKKLTPHPMPARVKAAATKKVRPSRLLIPITYQLTEARYLLVIIVFQRLLIHTIVAAGSGSNPDKENSMLILFLIPTMTLLFQLLLIIA